MSTIIALNRLVAQKTGNTLSLDGIVAAGLQIPLQPSIQSGFINAAVIELSHQVVHNRITTDEPNIFNTIDQNLPSYIPLDGLVGTVVSGYLNGTRGALVFAGAHYLIHSKIHQKHPLR